MPLEKRARGNFSGWLSPDACDVAAPSICCVAAITLTKFRRHEFAFKC